jgi:hypothetical protein
LGNVDFVKKGTKQKAKEHFALYPMQRIIEE